MKSVRERVAELMNGPNALTDVMQAMDLAQLSFEREISAEHQKELTKRQEESDKVNSVAVFCGVRCSGLTGFAGKTPHPSMSKACVALENGIGVEAASLAIGSDGETAYFPGRLWVFVAGSKPWSLTMSQSSQMLELLKTKGATTLEAMLEAAGGDAVLKAYTDKRAELVAAGTLTNRKKGSKAKK